MAALTASGVTLLESWSEGDVTGKRLTCKRVSLVLSTQGGATNNIPVSLFGFNKLIDASSFMQDDNTNFLFAAPSANQLLLLLGVATAPADVSGTYVGVVRGY